MQGSGAPSTARQIRRVVLTFVGLAVVTACLTMLFLSMRAVMDIGGSCASGGPYVVARPCPEGVGWLFPLSIWLGIFALGLYVASDAHLPGPKLAVLAWPALFISLGWNFWEYGLNPPGQEGVVWSWILCGAMFVAMGGGPLIGAVDREAFRNVLWADGDPEGSSEATRRSPSEVARRTVSAASPRIRTHASATASTTPSATTGAGAGTEDLAEDLERLADLHTAGKLTDSEFRAAKARRIAGDGS